MKMTITGKIFMVLFFFTFGFGSALYINKEKIFNENGVKTEITIEKNKDGNIIIDANSQQVKEEKEEKDKKFLGIF